MGPRNAHQLINQPANCAGTSILLPQGEQEPGKDTVTVNKYHALIEKSKRCPVKLLQASFQKLGVWSGPMGFCRNSVETAFSPPQVAHTRSCGWQVPVARYRARASTR